MTFQQDERLIGILRRSQVCPHLRQFNDEQMDGFCENAMYDPSAGHVPRGFGGATGELDDVRLVVVSNGPTDPIAGESYSGSPDDDLKKILTSEYMFDETQGIHKNLRLFLNWVFPDLGDNFIAQRRHVWTTNSLQCTFSNKRPVIGDRRRCSKYLIATLQHFQNPAVVLAGRKAAEIRHEIEDECTGLKIFECHSFSAPFPKGKGYAVNDWLETAQKARKHIASKSA